MHFGVVVTVCSHRARLCTFPGCTTSFFEVAAGLYPDLLQPHLVGVSLAVQTAWRRKGTPTNHQRVIGSPDPRSRSGPVSSFRQTAPAFAPATCALPEAECCVRGLLCAGLSVLSALQHGPRSSAGAVL